MIIKSNIDYRSGIGITEENIWPKILVYRWERDRNTANSECYVWTSTESD